MSETSAATVPFVWTYTGGDPSMLLFTRMIERQLCPLSLPLPAAFGPVLLDLGCAEEDWVDQARRQNPTLEVYGLDWRLGGQDAKSPDLYPPETLSLIACLGAIEHFGLGYYGDPKDPYGDVLAARNIARWLLPGGYAFIDVPWTPNAEPFETFHWRCYTDTSLAQRLIAPGMVEVDRFYAHAHTHEVYAGPPTEHEHPFTYCAVLLRKQG